MHAVAGRESYEEMSCAQSLMPLIVNPPTLHSAVNGPKVAITVVAGIMRSMAITAPRPALPMNATLPGPNTPQSRVDPAPNRRTATVPVVAVVDPVVHMAFMR